MLYFSNQELAENYHVSVRTIRNWIEAAKSGKLELVLHEHGKRTYVANTSKNIVVIQQLAVEGKKYRPHRSQKTVTPKSKFYELYSQEQIYDIVSSLEIHHEIPLKYSYFDGGAEYWDNYALRLAEEDNLNTLKASVELLASNGGYLDNLLAQYKQVNVIDLGAGNALPVKAFLEHLVAQDKLGRYIAIDISPAMLNIAARNISDWFGSKIALESYSMDFDYERFGHLLADEYIKSDSRSTCNIIIFFGGTINNFRNPDSVLSVIHDSMGVNDFLIHAQKLDTQSSRRYFDFNVNPSSSSLAQNHRLIFDLFNIDETFYDVEMGFNTKLSERYIRVVLKVALAIKFEFKTGERIISFDKGDVILLWRARQNNMLEVMSLFMENDLYPLQVSQTSSQEFMLTISRIKRD